MGGGTPEQPQSSLRRGSGLSTGATLPLGGGIPFGDTVAEANIAGLPPKTHLADGGPLMGGWYRMGLTPSG